MIRLKKLPEPEYLARNASEWARVLLEKLAANQVPSATEKSRYRHPDIKAALISETHGKCDYCESRLLHIHHGDVEHFYPKSLAPAKTFEWKNLTLACEICNQNKSDKDPLSRNLNWGQVNNRQECGYRSYLPGNRLNQKLTSP
jgi:5-methylcytosine-specific restriction endonuclease McrA